MMGTTHVPDRSFAVDTVHTSQPSVPDRLPALNTRQPLASDRLPALNTLQPPGPDRLPALNTLQPPVPDRFSWCVLETPYWCLKLAVKCLREMCW